MVSTVGCCFSESQQRLIQLEDAAKSAGVGKWSEDAPADHVREVTWNIEEPRKLVDAKHYKPIDGEHPCL